MSICFNTKHRGVTRKSVKTSLLELNPRAQSEDCRNLRITVAKKGKSVYMHTYNALFSEVQQDTAKENFQTQNGLEISPQAEQTVVLS